jgi:hypothetical protein
MPVILSVFVAARQVRRQRLIIQKVSKEERRVLIVTKDCPPERESLQEIREQRLYDDGNAA